VCKKTWGSVFFYRGERVDLIVSGVCRDNVPRLLTEVRRELYFVFCWISSIARRSRGVFDGWCIHGFPFIVFLFLEAVVWWVMEVSQLRSTWLIKFPVLC
jgi:hypothetical protein